MVKGDGPESDQKSEEKGREKWKGLTNG